MCETPSVFNAKAARARKRYHCCECDAWIEPGEIYESAFGVWANRAKTYRMCEPCWEIREQLRDDMLTVSPGSGLYADEIACALAYGRLAEELAEHCIRR
jgi:hypothetical protein